ncbi:UNKNOWN [Stylonychia lemnae]|uniref:Uncharacterized protein n=1 Tax=Stylonychia lemnae TaxID=5949 RepID=A0A078ALN2_STYLE|nr:UNKNOWN [Stylonychia lemnae]|eukprot:CDW83134.1 UNKNOWN [Stylonychia lemnae]
MKYLNIGNSHLEGINLHRDNLLWNQDFLTLEMIPKEDLSYLEEKIFPMHQVQKGKMIKEVVKSQQHNPVSAQDVDDEFLKKNEELQKRSTPYKNKFQRKKANEQLQQMARNMALQNEKGYSPKINSSEKLQGSNNIDQEDLIELQRQLKERLSGMNLRKIIQQGGKSIELLLNKGPLSKIDSFNRYYFNVNNTDNKSEQNLGKKLIYSRNLPLAPRESDKDEIEMFKGSFLF